MAVIRRSVRTFSTSRADDAAFHALSDASRALEARADARVVGGQSVALLLAAFPALGAIPRRTADADLAISTTLAASGSLHTRLTAAGYRATAGNSYAMGERTIDLVVAAPAGRFVQEEHGGRSFDAAPGVMLALAAQPIVLDVEVMLLDGSTLEFEAPVPSPEVVTALKAYTTVSRSEAKDVIDLHNLLTIADSYPADEIGGWSLAQPGLRGSRRDTARILHRRASTARRDPALRDSGVNPARLTALIRKHIATQE
jgi:hypothetical protein